MATVLAPARGERGFERLYRRYAADVYRYVLAVLQSGADAEDATQTAFLSAFRAYEQGERPERPLNWLIAIAHNVCRQRFRESARRPRFVELGDDVAARQVDDGAPSAEEIRRALGFLAFNQRAALVMREVQGRSYSEIANILGVSNAAVETLLFRARRAMREQLDGGLTCGEAELALSKRADGELSFAERGQLRAHLRECRECAALERRLRFRTRALKKAAFVPLPESLTSFLGSGAAGTGGAAAGAKAAAVLAAAVFGTTLASNAVEETMGALGGGREPAASASRPADAGARAVWPQAQGPAGSQATSPAVGPTRQRPAGARSTGRAGASAPSSAGARRADPPPLAVDGVAEAPPATGAATRPQSAGASARNGNGSG